MNNYIINKIKKEINKELFDKQIISFEIFDKMNSKLSG